MNEIPKPRPPKKSALEVDKKDAPKKEYFLKPHLTHRPFHNAGLISLRDGMRQSYNIKQR